METVVGSLALFDFDLDGLIDIYFVNGSPLQDCPADASQINHLYRNNGDWTFTDVTEQSGLGDSKYGMGVVIGDYDNDGDPDLFLSNFGTNSFFQNQGDGTFVETARETGLEGIARFGAGNAFLDIDNDGDLDLYAASYLNFKYENHKTRFIAGYEFHVGPNDYPPASDYLYRNEGDGTFVDISARSGVAQYSTPSMGVVAVDVDDDSDVDLFVANDQKPNLLLINDGKGNFIDDALIAGVAFDRNGNANSNMGVEFADLNNDQLLDIVSTTYQEELPVLYQSVAPGFFIDATIESRIDPTLLPHVNWGTGAEDFDNDGDLDLFIACGHFLDNIQYIDDRTELKNLDRLMLNDSRGRFSPAKFKSTSILSIKESSRACAFDDLDNDGDQDVVVINVNAPPTLGRTEAPVGNKGISIRLVGTTSNRDGIGAKLLLRDDSGREQFRPSIAGRGYESYYGGNIHFGIGTNRPVEAAITWPSGVAERFTIRLNDSFSKQSPITLLEGSGRSVNE